MCGIFFSLGFENLPASVIDSVAHRGPDGRGWNEFMSSNGPVVMAHRRLAIVDLSADGHQPMSTKDGRYWVTYNGEIYNYLEIREELEELGYHFKTKTDTEVLLKSYLQWGEECLHKFNGMFAFVIWDDKEKKIFAARDRFGVKPLYYYKQGNKIAFASEIKQFKQFPGWINILHPQMAEEYINKRYCDHKKETLYRDIFQILPGHFFLGKSSCNQQALICWYELKNYIEEYNITEDEAIERFRSLFEDAIRLRLRSDVSVGACLSGGLDSSSIVSMVRNIQGPKKEIYTFSSVFPGFKVDESIYIEALAKEKRLVSSKNYPTFDSFLKNLDSMLYHQDLPFSGTSVFAQWSTFQSAQKTGIKVLLDGQGADESLLGYPGMLNGLVYDYLQGFQCVQAYKFLKWQSNYNTQSVRKTFILGLQQKFPGFYAALLKIYGEKEYKIGTPFIRTITDICIEHFSNNLQTLLRYEDRNSMAFSRESRLPFLDYRLVEFIFSLPINQRFKDLKTKWVLREAMKNINISSILARKDKIGFATPEKEWEKKLISSKINSDINVNKKFPNFIWERWLGNEKFRY